ncbi:hypothetical protein BS47DRAFT_1340863 [Hydnum rufescens UP504]|uniref:Nucleic acid-binding protein n=1 Tax=Hydnum rufescens UP504 TaxID=1448309 RepID=A0A9P6B2Y7_9AGAM|nr:hypothetical protein BS47DRAFT_1340863 [Hydnum rufescens UP504]
MSTSNLLSKLSASLQEFVRTAARDNAAFGNADQESAELSEWLSKVSSLKISNSADLKHLDETLSSKTYLVGTSPTVADISLYGTLHASVAKLSPPKTYAYPSIIRYFDHLQNLLSVRSLHTFPAVSFDFENAPKIERLAEAPKEKKKDKPAKEATQSIPTSASSPAPTAPPVVPLPSEAKPANSDPVNSDQKAGKKEKKEKPVKKDALAPANNNKSKGGAPPPATSDSGDPLPSMIDLRVGKIVQVARHPDADGLYVEQIDIGEETGPRTVVSGLVNYIPIEQMQDRTIIVVANLKPANMRGIKSFAMVLCASSKEGKDGGIEFVEPPPGSKPGERVFFEGEKYQDALPLPQLNPKKKIWEAIQPSFTTLQNRDAAWVDAATGSVHRIITKDGVCAPRSLVGASLS